MNGSSPDIPSVLIRASAGTGKTFQLSNRYLKLLNIGVLPEHILAVTFTRMAAGEIMDRVMMRLANAALDETQCQQLGKLLDDSEFDTDRCTDLLQQLTRQLHRMRIETLDSYFSKLARAFALELGKPPGWTIVEDLRDEQMKIEAIQKVLRQNAHEIYPLMNLLFKGDADRNISRQLLDTVNDVYLIFRGSDEQAWKDFPPTEILDVRELRAALGQLEQLDMDFDKRFSKAHAEGLDAAREMNWDEWVKKGLAAKIAQGESSYYGKPIPPEAIAVYERLLQHSRGVILDDVAKQTTATFELLSRFDQQYTALKRKYRAYRFDDIQFDLSEFRELESIHENTFRMDARISHLLVDEFQDTSLCQWEVLRPLARHLTQPPSQKSFFFMGGPTSLFCVGDPKQAIYGWRGGQAGIFDELPRELDTDESERLSIEPLDLSYRSSPVVMDFVNRVFAGLPDRSRLENAKAGVLSWCSRFPQQQTSLTDLPGYASIHISQGRTEDVKAEDNNLRYAAAHLKQLHDQAPDKTYGVLVRRNRIASRLVSLIREQGLRASEERGGHQLTDSACVELIMSALKLADHPGDRIARYHLSQSQLGPQLGLRDFRDCNAAAKIAAGLRDELAWCGYGLTIKRLVDLTRPFADPRQRRRLQQLVQLAYAYQGLATLRPTDFVNFVATKKVPDPVPSNIRVMTIHQAKGLEFDVVLLPDLDQLILSQLPRCIAGRPTPTSRIDRVCRRVNKTARVLLPPDLQELFDNAMEEDVHEELCVLYVALTRAVHALHIIAQPTSNHSTFISTLLRASVQPDAKDAIPGSVFYESGDISWFRQPQACPKPKVEDAEHIERPIQAPLRFREPDNSDWRRLKWTPHAQPVDQPDARESSSVRQGMVEDSSDIGARPPRATPSGRESATAIKTAGSLLQLNHVEYQARGALLHRWFEQVTWLDENRPVESKLLRSIDDLPIGHLDLKVELDDFRSLLDSTELGCFFQKRQYLQSLVSVLAASTATAENAVCQDWDVASIRQNLPQDASADVDQLAGELELDVSTERKFAVLDPTNPGSLLTGTIDRLILVKIRGQVIAADIIDFKTDTLDPNSPASCQAATARHASQLAAYRQAVKTMYGLANSCINTRLIFTNYRLMLSTNAMPSSDAMLDSAPACLPLRHLKFCSTLGKLVPDRSSFVTRLLLAWQLRAQLRGRRSMKISAPE